MAELKRLTFREFVTLQRGFDLPKKNIKAGVYPVVGSTSIIGYHSEFKAIPPGVVIGRSGSLGSVLYVSDKYWPHNTSLWVRDFKGNIPKYVYYFLQTLELQRYDSGAAVPTLNRNHLDSLELRIHDLSTQRKIAAVLSAYDDLIENNTRRIKILEEMAGAIYREWFVKFRFPGHENVTMVESELGLIPKGWKVRQLGEVAQLHRGRSYRSQNLVNEGEGLPFLNLKNIEREGGFRSDGLKWYDGKFQDSQIAIHNDIIMALTDMTQERRIVARSARVPSLAYKKFVFSMDLLKIQPNGGIQPDFLCALLRYSSIADTLKEHANGTTVLHLSPDHVQSSKLILPTREIRQRYSEVAKRINQQNDWLAKKNINLRQTRDMLLPKLTSGELDVSTLNIGTDLYRSQEGEKFHAT